MSLTVSPPIRVVALLGLVAAITLGAGFTLLGRSHSSTAAAPIVVKHHPFGPGVKKHTAAATHEKAAAPAKAHVTITAHKTTHPTPARPVAELEALSAGLPAPVAHALGQHSVVVVELYDPQAEVDGISFAEAKAGAQLAGAGFVGLDVLKQADVGGLTQRAGEILPDPGVLVYTRPATLAVRIDGFVDKETVAQAAQNAAPAGTRVAAPPTWWARVNSACASLTGNAPVLVLPATRAQVRVWVTKQLALEKQALASFAAIPLAAAGAQRASAVKFLALVRKTIADEQKLADVLANGGTFSMSLVREDQSVSKQAQDLAAKMGATACAAG